MEEHSNNCKYFLKLLLVSADHSFEKTGLENLEQSFTYVFYDFEF